MSLYEWSAEEYGEGNLIAFCMGEAGKNSRLECLKAGSPYTYAALSEEEAAAPGQWPVEEMKKAVYEDFSFIGKAGNEMPLMKMPVSKSFAQRAIIAAALADGVSHLRGYTPCGDNEAAIVGELDNINVSIAYENGEQVVYLNGENVNGLIRTPEAGNMASAVSVFGKVRAKMVELQQNLAKTTSVVMDGRDIGTVVLPNAEVKIYLTASSEVRAKRRYDELIAKGMECDLATLQKEIEERDYRDMNREVSPLKKADDAVELDTSYMTIPEVVEAMQRIIAEKIGA
jgi:cytidylate kinase